MSLAYHVNFRLADGRVIAPTHADRLRLARSLLGAAAGFDLLAFCGPDTHLHLVAVCDRARACELARRVKIGLQRSLSLRVAFSPTWFQPIEGQQHLERAVEYVLGQHAHHATSHDPTRDASNLPDLLGLRLLGRRTLGSLRTFAPRLGASRLVRHLGVSQFPDDYDLSDLAGAAMSAACVTSLRERTPEAVAARRAAVHVAGARLASPALARLLELGGRTVRDLRKAAPPLPELVRAVLLQLRFRQALRQAAAARTTAAA